MSTPAAHISSPTTDTDTRTDSRPQPPSARAPRGIDTAVPAALLLGLLVVALGVITGRDVLILSGALHANTWVTALVAGPTVWHREGDLVLLIATAAIAIGLLLLTAALKPRSRTHRRLAHANVWMRKRDITTLIIDAAKTVPGVDDAHTSGSSRRQKLRITPNVSAAIDLPALQHDIDTAVTRALDVLADPPKLTTTLRKAHRS